MFKTGDTATAVLQVELRLAGLLIVGGLAADFLQYVYGAFAWGFFARLKERANYRIRGTECQPVDDFKVHPGINYFSLLFFWSKIVLILGAYYFLIAYLLLKFLN